MTGLKDLQQRFVASLSLKISDPLLFKEFLPENSEVPKNSNSFFNVHQRFQCYRNNRQEILYKTLEALYPTCQRWVGEKCFRGLSLEYIHHFVSKYFNLYHYGQEFPHFLKECHEKYFKTTYSLEGRFLIELARFEWTIHQLLLGPVPSSKPQTRHAVQNQDPDMAVFHSMLPVDKVWEAHQDSESPDLGFLSVAIEEDVYVRLFRMPDFRLKLRRISQSEWEKAKMSSEDSLFHALV